MLPSDICSVVANISQELIKVKGNQVAPAELEAVLLDHPAIADVAVIGITKAGGDEEYPRAYVVPKEGQKVDEKEIQTWLESKVAHYKRLTGGVRELDAVPRNPVSLSLTVKWPMLTT